MDGRFFWAFFSVVVVLVLSVAAVAVFQALVGPCQPYAAERGRQCWPGHHLEVRGLVAVCECDR